MANEATETFGILVEALSNLQDVCNGAIGVSLPKVSTSAFQHSTEVSLSIAMYWHWLQNPGSIFFSVEKAVINFFEGDHCGQPERREKFGH